MTLAVKIARFILLAVACILIFRGLIRFPGLLFGRASGLPFFLGGWLAFALSIAIGLFAAWCADRLGTSRAASQDND